MAIKTKNPLRDQVLKQLFDHYMIHDANLGRRMRANCQPFRFLPDVKKKIPKEIKFKNFFEITTDSHGFIANKINQKRNYADLAKRDDIFKILITGNSVSAGSGVSSCEKNWPAILEDILNQDKNFHYSKYNEIMVINSCALGHNISQEIRRFQDETIYLNPHLVISFSGFYSKYNYYGNPIDDANHENQQAINNYFNFGEDKIDDGIYPYKQDDYIKLSAADLLISKIKQFRGICNSHNIDFMFILQPFMGLGNKVLNKEELDLQKYFESYFFEAPWEEYQENLQSFANKVVENLNEDYQYSFINIFDDVKETLYCDPRHQNDNGHKIIAQKVANLLKNNIK